MDALEQLALHTAHEVLPFVDKAGVAAAAALTGRSAASLAARLWNRLRSHPQMSDLPAGTSEDALCARILDALKADPQLAIDLNNIYSVHRTSVEQRGRQNVAFLGNVADSDIHIEQEGC